MASALMDEVSADTAERLLSVGTRRRYPAKSFLFHEGDEPSSVIVVETGMLRVDRTLSTGRRVLLTLATPGDLVGELSVIDGVPRSATAATLTESRVLVVPAGPFNDLLVSTGDLATVMLRRITHRLRALTDQFVEASAHSAASRVAARLVELLLLTERESEAAAVELRLPITQEELAQWAGLSREGAVKGLGELRAAGIIETGRRRMTILDPDGLRSVATRADRSPA
jgi:CRP-like cAMP-binding protein